MLWGIRTCTQSLAKLRIPTPPQSNQAVQAGAKDSERSETSLMTIYWEWALRSQDYANTVNSIQTSSTDNLISALIPLSISSPRAALHMDLLVQYILSDTDADDPIPFFQRRPCRAKFAVRIAVFQAKRSQTASQRSGQSNETERVPISQGPIVKKQQGIPSHPTAILAVPHVLC